jgi:signal transduction histidine kinase
MSEASRYGIRFVSSSYAELVSAADRFFGGLCLLSLIVAGIAWRNGDANWLGAGMIALFIVVNVLISRVAVRVPEQSRLRIELIRIFGVNSILCPALLIGTGRSLFPWWPGYFIAIIGTAVVLGAAYPHRRWIGIAGMLFWGGNLALAGIVGLPPERRYTLVLQIATLLMTGFIFLRYTRVFMENALSEYQRFQDALAQLKSAQAQLVESGKLAALGQMAGGIAHEINSPLATVQLATRQIRRATEAASVDRALILERTEMIQSVMDRIAGIITGLRSFCQDGSMDPLTTVSVGKVIQDTLVFCEQRFRVSGVPLRVDAPGLEAEIHCRPVQLSQVLLNLLNNAYDAVRPLPGRGVRLRVAPSEEIIRVHVEDEGEGIPEEIRERVFEPFFTTKGAGTGLGLSISKKIIEAHGGRLNLSSQDGKTEFTIELPSPTAAG